MADTTDYERILPAIVARMQAVGGIGLVFDLDRRVDRIDDWTPYKVTVGGVLQIRGWDVVSPSDRYETLTVPGHHQHYVRWLIMGYQESIAAIGSQQVFRALSETVCRALRADRKLGGIVDGCTPAAVTRFAGRATYGSIKLHYVEIEFDAWCGIAIR